MNATTQEQEQEQGKEKPAIELLVIRIQAGESSLFAGIVEELQQPIYRYCCHLLGNRHDAEDAVQDIFVKVYQSMSRYSPTASFSAWLYRIAGNHCINLLRRRRLQFRIQRLFHPSAASPGPEQELDERLFSYPLSEALMQLSPEDRNLLVLRVFEQRTFAEIGDILQTTPNALHKRFEKMKRKIRNVLTTEEEMFCSDSKPAVNSSILIRASSRTEELPRIQVTGKVMARIRALPARRVAEKSGRTRRTSTIVAGLLILLLVTATAYAANEWITIRDADGKVKVQYAPPNPENHGASDAYDKYRQLALKQAKPDELIAYLDKGTDGKPQVRYAYKEKLFTDYADFRRRMTQAATPLLPAKAAGYAFEHGSVGADYPRFGTKTYQDTLAELLKRQSSSSPGASITKAIPWTKGAWVGAVYMKGSARIDLSANLLLGGIVHVEQEPGNHPETLTIAGRTIIFNDVVRPEVSYHYINWYNEQQDAYYILTTSGGHQLDKAHLVELAGELIKGGL